MAVSNSFNSMSRYPVILMLESMKTRSVYPSDDTPTDNIIDLENVECLHRSRSAGSFFDVS